MSKRSFFDAMHDALEAQMPPLPEQYKDWTYRDVRRPLTRRDWRQLLAIIGKGNYHLLTEAKTIRDGQTRMRGQMYISPAGMANLIKHERKNQKD